MITTFKCRVNLLYATCSFVIFICWTTCGLHLEQIIANNIFFQDMKPALDKFFLSVILPQLLTGSTSCTSTHSDVSKTSQVLPPNTYCWCGGEDEGWLLVITSHVQSNGFILNVLDSHVNLGFVLITVKQLTCHASTANNIHFH